MYLHKFFLKIPRLTRILSPKYRSRRLLGPFWVNDSGTLYLRGHGRSVAVMCALLVALSIVEDWKEAEKFIKKRRPSIRMNALQRKALEEWSKHQLSTPKRNE